MLYDVTTACAHFSPYDVAHAYQLTAKNRIETLPDLRFPRQRLTLTVPAPSATLAYRVAAENGLTGHVLSTK